MSDICVEDISGTSISGGNADNWQVLDRSGFQILDHPQHGFQLLRKIMISMLLYFPSRWLFFTERTLNSVQRRLNKILIQEISSLGHRGPWWVGLALLCRQRGNKADPFNWIGGVQKLLLLFLLKTSFLRRACVSRTWLNLHSYVDTVGSLNFVTKITLVPVKGGIPKNLARIAIML